MQPRPEPLSDRAGRLRARAWIAVGVLAGLTNANFLLRPLAGSPLSPSTTEVSLLSVPGQPLSWAFRLGDLAAGLLGLGLAVGVFAATRGSRAPARVYGRLLAAALAAFGVGTVAAAAVTLSCAMERGCQQARPAQDVLHDALSVLATTGTVLGCVVLLRVHSRRPTGRSVLGGGLLAVAVVVLAALQAVYFLAGAQAGAGWIQRGQVLGSSAWLVLVGVLLHRFAAGRARRTPAPVAGAAFAAGSAPSGVLTAAPGAPDVVAAAADRTRDAARATVP